MDFLRQKLIGLINATKRKKPYRCEVEYLQSTGKQYIDTGYNIVSSTDEVSCYFQLITSDKYFWLMGEHDNGARFGIGSGDGSNLRNIAYGASTYKVNDTEVYNSQHYFNSNSNGVYVNGTLVHAYENFTSTSTVYLFNLNISGGGNAASGKIWRFTHKRSGKVIRDFIPVLDWNDKPAMYDKVSGELFYNQGTDVDFSYGREIHRVDYISSPNKNVCFNTGIFPQFDNFKIEVRAIKEAGTSLFGVTGTGNFYDLTGSGSNNYGHYGASAGSFASFALTDQNMPHTFMMENGNIYCDGVLKGSKANETITSAFPMGLFARITNASGSFNDSGNHTMYYAKIWNNGSLVRDYYPAIDETGKAFLFDKVSHQIFDNSGTGVVNYPPVELDYIESTGTQYINTGIKLNNNSSIQIDYQLTQAVQSRTGLFGALNMTGSNQGRIGSILSPSNQQLEHGYGAGNEYWQQGMPDTNRHVIYQKKNETYFDGSLVHSFDTATFSLVIDAYLGNFLFTNYTPAKAKYYSSKWWDGDTLVRKFVPAYKDGVAGWYDKVNNVFYTNAGTGTFTVGKIKDYR